MLPTLIRVVVKNLSDALGRGSNRPPARVFNKGERVSKISVHAIVMPLLYTSHTKTASRNIRATHTSVCPSRRDAAFTIFRSGAFNVSRSAFRHSRSVRYWCLNTLKSGNS
jgi:hypothetical protein